MKAVKDFQRQAVYRAEDECSFWLQGKYFSEEEADELITRIAEWAEIKKPDCQFNAVDKDGEIFPVAKGMAHSIVLPSRGEIDFHGPIFVNIYINIIRKILGYNYYKELLNRFKFYNIQGV